MVVAILAGIVIFSAIPNTYAETADTVDVKIELNTLSDYYISGDVLNLEPELYNPSSTTHIDNNPSCDYTFEVFNAVNSLIFSSENNCRNQIQALEINQGERLELMRQTWDFTGSDGQEVPTGSYLIVVSHSIVEISDTQVLQYFGNSTLPNNLELIYKTVDISSNDATAELIQLFIHNPTADKVSLAGVDCNIVIESDLNREIFDNCLDDIQLLHPYENMYVGNHIIDQQWLDSSDSFNLYLTGGSQFQQLNSITPTTSVEQTDDGDQVRPDLQQITYHLTETDSNPHLSIMADYHTLTNSQINNCDLKLLIVNDYGEIYHSDVIDFCQTTTQASEISPDVNRVKVYDWVLLSEDSCLVDFGKYTIILEGKQFSKADFFLNIPNDSSRCNDNNLQIDMDNQVAENSLYTTIKITTDNNLRVFSDCTLVVNMVTMDMNDEILQNEFCDYNSGNFFTPPNGIYEIHQKVDIPNELIASEYIAVTHKISFEYTSIYSENIYLVSGQMAINPKSTYQISGVWNSIALDDEQCWMISAPNSAYILQDGNHDSGWAPKESWYGEYLVTENRQHDGFCSQFGLPIISITEIFVDEDPNAKTAPATTIQEVDDETITLTDIAVYGVTSSSILISFKY